MQTRLRNVMKKLFIITGAFGLLLGACVLAIDNYCDYQNSIPHIPLHPASRLIDTASVGTTRYPLVTYDYTVGVTHEELLNFYARNDGQCREANRQDGVHYICQGNTRSSGEYFVYIDSTTYQSNGETEYIVEIHWHGCTYELE